MKQFRDWVWKKRVVQGPKTPKGVCEKSALKTCHQVCGEDAETESWAPGGFFKIRRRGKLQISRQPSPPFIGRGETVVGGEGSHSTDEQ